MIANHIHDALAQVKKLEEFILQKRLFKGYSGWARIVSGTAALVGAALMASDLVPADVYVHLDGWGYVVLAGLVLNYGWLLYWAIVNREVRQNPVVLKPALDALPAITVGAFMTLALVLAEQFDLLFGTWMCLYGLAQVAYRSSLPAGIYSVGVGYILCGAWCLTSKSISFLNPWPMGIVFFVGELAGGVVLLRYSSGVEK